MQHQTLICILVWLLATVGATAARAESAMNQNFIGPAAGFVASLQNSTITVSNPTQSTSGTGDDSAAMLLGSWGIQLSDRWVATLGLGLDLNNTNLATLTRQGVNFSAKAKEHTALSISPGYRLSPDLLFYGKLAYHHFKVEATNVSTNTSESRDFAGLGYGLGLALALTRNVELRAEYEMVTNDVLNLYPVSAKFEQNRFNLGLLYKF